MLRRLNRKISGAKRHPVRVLQFGGGNFLRGFADWIIDLMNERADFNGAVQIVLSVNKAMTAAFAEQEGLYYVQLKGILEGQPISETRLITCVKEAIDPMQDYELFLHAAENPDLSFIVSNTTETGIAFDSTDAGPAVYARSFPGKLTALLYRRFLHFSAAPDKGFIVLPCELIENNGTVLRDVVLLYARHWKLPAEFTEWLLAHNYFCNTLVDRIVPGFTKSGLQSFQEVTGYFDTLAVMAEPFHLWVIEAPEFVTQQFPADRAQLQVKFVSSVSRYRTTKVRILNGSHTALMPVAYFLGFRAVKESVDDAALNIFIRTMIFQEIIPTLDVPLPELNSFAESTIERFGNPFIHHELKSIALNSISKFRVRLLPSLVRYIEERKELPPCLVFAFAALIRFYQGKWRGDLLPVNDSAETIHVFENAWSADQLEKTVQEILSSVVLWGQDLTLLSGLTSAVAKNLKRLESYEKNALLNPLPAPGII